MSHYENCITLQVSSIQDQDQAGRANLNSENRGGTFSQLYIVMQHGDGDMDILFKHANHWYPLSLTDRESYAWERSLIC